MELEWEVDQAGGDNDGQSHDFQVGMARLNRLKDDPLLDQSVFFENVVFTEFFEDVVDKEVEGHERDDVDEVEDEHDAISLVD